jgi:prepilin-type N-terminal cleavage/methylation domain-containing protein
MVFMKKGFTLIELLVVIAIIGVLASIVMVSMSGASDKAKDARIQGDLSQTRSLAEMIYDDDSDYEDVCSGGTLKVSGTGYDTQMSAISSDITAQGGSFYNCLNDGNGGNQYCIAVVLNSGEYYCVDSDGMATTVSSMGSNCTSTDYDCS